MVTAVAIKWKQRKARKNREEPEPKNVTDKV
jgi:hypothetical protein